MYAEEKQRIKDFTAKVESIRDRAKYENRVLYAHERGLVNEMERLLNK